MIASAQSQHNYVETCSAFSLHLTAYDHGRVSSACGPACCRQEIAYHSDPTARSFLFFHPASAIRRAPEPAAAASQYVDILRTDRHYFLQNKNDVANENKVGEGP